MEGNFIGTNAAGTAALPNGLNGVYIQAGAFGNTIGGSTTAAANVISGNTQYGIQVDGSTTTGNVVENNYVGTQAGGSGTLLNTVGALELTNGAAAAVNGSFTGNVLNQGVLTVANSPGTLAVTGNYTQSSTASLSVNIGGTTAGTDYDQLTATGTASISGTLNVADINGFFPDPTQSFTTISATSVRGTFGAVNYPTYMGRSLLSIQYNTASVVLKGTTIIVNSTADAGSQGGGGSPDTVNLVNGQPQITLRSAIQAADALSGTQYIDFHIPTSDSGYSGGIWTITPASALPTITTSVYLDGTTQPGYSGTPVVQLSGGSAGAGVNGLTFSAGNSTVRGFVINGFTGDGIDLTTNGGDTVQGNYIGTNAAGTAALANGSSGVLISGSADNTIGGTTAAARNIISGNTGDGIDITGSGTTGNLVEGNYIGTNAAGTAAVANQLAGIDLASGASSNTIGGTTAGAGNVISGNTQYGIEVNSGVTGTSSRATSSAWTPPAALPWATSSPRLSCLARARPPSAARRLPHATSSPATRTMASPCTGPAPTTPSSKATTSVPMPPAPPPLPTSRPASPCWIRSPTRPSAARRRVRAT